MAQFGARNMALASSTYWDILEHFYTDIHIGVAQPTADRRRVYLCSPGEVRVYDAQGRVTGQVEGQIKQEIPNSSFFDDTVQVFSPAGSYRYQVVGTEWGTYGLNIASINAGEMVTFDAFEIPTSGQAVHQYTIDWNALTRGEEGVTVQVDSDGDGTFERNFTADSDLTRDEFLAGGITPVPVGGHLSMADRGAVLRANFGSLIVPSVALVMLIGIIAFAVIRRRPSA